MDRGEAPLLEGTVIRPPSEADSLIVQLTLGCSDNRCSFCPAYKGKAFRVKEAAAVEQELERACAAACRSFPKLTRIGIYGSVRTLEGKTVEQLRALKNLKLGIVYLGFETGDDEVYRRTGKYGSPAGNIAVCRKVIDAGIRTNVTVILGLGGKERSRAHAENTARILNEAKPHQIAALTLMIAPGTPLYERHRRDEFAALGPFEFLEELRILVGNLADFACLFFSNHASNYFPIAARFPRDRAAVLAGLDAVLARRASHLLTPEHLRGL